MSSSRIYLNVLKVLVVVVSIFDLIINIYNVISTYIGKRDGVYYQYEWQWNSFYAIRIIVAVVVLYGVFKSNLRLLILCCVINGLAFAVIIYAVAWAKLKYNTCERELCAHGGICDICYSRNYGDYHLTTKWAAFLFFKTILVIAYIIVAQRKPSRQNFEMRTTV